MKIERIFIIKNSVALLITALGLIFLSREGAFDFWLASLSYDYSLSRFPLQDHILLESIGHTGLRNFAIFIWFIILGLFIFSFRSQKLAAWRHSLAFGTVAILSSTLIVSLVKSMTAHACPWDLTNFGGTLHWYPLLGSYDDVQKLGKCWPGGHSSGGFAFVGGYFALCLFWARAARWILAFALVLGGVMSLIQQIRGAHFLSHNLWSLWFCWMVSFLFYLLWPWPHAAKEPFKN